jgi:peptide/nickel transport system ATP-binding protein
MPLLEIKDLQLEFGRDLGHAVRVLHGVSLSINAGETVALVGESGCGKSVTALSVARLLREPPAHYPGGEVLVEGRDVLQMPAAELRRIRGGVVSYVFQEPGASLDPVVRVGSQIKEMLALHRPGAVNNAEVVRLLTMVGMSAPQTRIRSYPHELSGGMQQRVMLAIALASNPKLLIADEPTTALDVTIQAQIIALIAELRTRLGMAVLLITHNLGLVNDFADRIAVMYAGQIVEAGSAVEVLSRPLHPYTRALIESVPRLEDESARLTGIPGAAPQPDARLPGCRFQPRCDRAQPQCASVAPVLEQPQPARWVRCPYFDNSISTATPCSSKADS